MTQDASPPTRVWNEQDSQAFMDLGRYVVPQREEQMQTLCALLPPCAPPCHIVELCCGEGLLAQAILEHLPDSIVHGFDGSQAMLVRAQSRLAAYGARFETQAFELSDNAWRQFPWPVQAVVSSLAIHHLEAAQKQALFRDMYAVLRPGGAFIMADLIQPAHPCGVDVAAQAWNDAVRQRALELDGHTAAYDEFQREHWNYYIYPDPVDKPSRLLEQLQWLEEAGFTSVDAYWLKAGHAILGGYKASETR